MAKIIYGVSGQGLGHGARSREIIRYLKKQGHQVMIFTYGHGLFLLTGESDLMEVPGLGLHYHRNRLVYWGTIFYNARQLLKQSKRWRRIRQDFRRFDPDLVITDFEAITAALAHLERRPLISIDNQHQLTKTRVAVPPGHWRDFLIDRWIIKAMVWGARHYLVATFFDTKPNRRRVELFPTIVRSEIMALEPSRGDYFLVYANESATYIINVLRGLRHRFIVVGFDRDDTQDNLTFKKYSADEWLNDLAGCRAVIGTAGLSLISESMYLGKPYLALPIAKQIEQEINAYYVEQMGFGTYSDNLTSQQIEQFINRLSEFEQVLSLMPRRGNEAICKRLNAIIKELTS